MHCPSFLTHAPVVYPSLRLLLNAMTLPQDAAFLVFFFFLLLLLFCFRPPLSFFSSYLFFSFHICTCHHNFGWCVEGNNTLA